MSKLFTGTVVSTKMQKTIVVEIERRFRHHLYKKVIARSKKHKVHYEGNKIKEGDTVTIRETKPLSKDKHFIVVEGKENSENKIGKKVISKKAIKGEAVSS